MSDRWLDPRDTKSSVYLGADERWHGKVTVGRKPNGQAIRAHRSAEKRALVVAKVRELERQRDSGLLVVRGDNPTLAAWLEHWLRNVVWVRNRPKTFASYTSAMRCHVIPQLGTVRLQNLTTEHLEDLYGSLAGLGIGPHTVHAVHRVLRSSLSEAVRRRRISHNPARNAVIRAPREVEVNPLTVIETQQILAAACDPTRAARWSIALALGLRQGEVLGLQWNDVDAGAGVLHVRRSLQRISWQHGCGESVGDDPPPCGKKRGGSCPWRHGGGLLLAELKTSASKRTVSLPPPIAEQLRAHRQNQLRERLRSDAEWSDHDLVFTTPTGKPIDPKHDGQAWQHLLRTAGVRRARLHDARHTAATLLLALGVDQRTVMDIMGWTEQRTANRYMHVPDVLRVSAAERTSAALWPLTGV